MIISVLQLTFKPDMAAEGLDAVRESLKATRGFEGCLGVEVAQDVSDPRKLTIVERWQSLEHDSAYRAWASANAGRSKVGPLLAAAPVKAIGTLRDDV